MARPNLLPSPAQRGWKEAKAGHGSCKGHAVPPGTTSCPAQPEANQAGDGSCKGHAVRSGTTSCHGQTEFDQAGDGSCKGHAVLPGTTSCPSQPELIRLMMEAVKDMHYRLAQPLARPS